MQNRKFSSSTRLIIQHLKTVTVPESYRDVSEATGVSYWTSRVILRDLTKQGITHVVEDGASPRFVLAHPIDTAQKFGIETKGIPASEDWTNDHSGLPSPGFLRRVSSGTSPTGSNPDSPTGTPLERIMIAAMRRLTLERRSVDAAMLAGETGSSRAEIQATLASLIGRGVVECKECPGGQDEYRLKPEYRMLVSINHARILPNAEIEGGRKSPSLADDVVALHHLLYGVFPVASILAYLSYLPEFLTDEAQKVVADVQALETEAKELGLEWTQYMVEVPMD